jgi:hypothetical protein
MYGMAFILWNEDVRNERVKWLLETWSNTQYDIYWIKYCIYPSSSPLNVSYAYDEKCEKNEEQYQFIRENNSSPDSSDGKNESTADSDHEVDESVEKEGKSNLIIWKIKLKCFF